MKLTACLYIDDDGLAGSLSVYDSPCSWPACLHARLPLSPGEVATVLEYIECADRGGKMERGWLLMRTTERSISFTDNELRVVINGCASITVKKESVILGLSSKFCEDIDALEARLGIEDVE